MNKEKLIALIERELVQAEEAVNEAEFSKHMYAIHTLTSLYTDSDTSTSHQKPSVHQPSSFTAVSQQAPNTPSVSAEEIKAMGGKVSSQFDTPNTSTPPGASNKMVTDDQFGNGDSIFDF